MRKFGPENFDFPIVGSKIKVVVESSVTYQNLSAEKYKTNGKRISSIQLNYKVKSPKYHPKIPSSRKVHFFKRKPRDLKTFLRLGNNFYGKSRPKRSNFANAEMIGQLLTL